MQCICRARSLALLLLLTPILPGRTATAQSSPRDNDTISAPIANVRYEVTFTRALAEQQRVGVAMSFGVTGDGPVVLSLPAWTPGAYEISNFARWVLNFTPTADGKPLAWDKVDFDTWRIRTRGVRTVRVEFEYAADTLDNAMAWARPDFLLFNGTNLFLYPEGRPLEMQATVTVHTDPQWRVATGMAATATTGAGVLPNTFSAANYHDLVDMPFFVGRFDIDSARIANRWVRLATYPMGSVSGAVRQTAWDQLKRVIPPEVAVFADAPWDSYTVMQIVDSTFGGASGLEHQNSHVDVVAPAYVGSEFQPSLYAHEIFHSWNVKRLRPAELWPYQYARPQPTPWLWVSEGITDYYADLAEVRGGVVDARGFYALTATKINEVRSVTPVALEDASLNTWVHPVDGTGYLYYGKGSLAGFMLDILIRDASDNKRSLDDVMRELYQSTYKRGRGFTATDWWNAVSAAAGGRSFATFHARYIDGREPFPWDSVLVLAGMRSYQERIPRLGVLTQGDPQGIVVVNVDETGAAAAAGVKAGDYLVSVGDIPVEDQTFGAKMRAKYASTPEGTPLPIKIRRGTETITLQGRLRFGPGEIGLDADPRASAKAARIRDGILKGTVNR
jgi:predicted metalloprotease with PDZ domain